MTGLQVKQILLKNGYVLNDIASKLGESSQNFSASLKVQDIKTGTLERIAGAIDKHITFFYGEGAQVANANGEFSTAIAGNNISNTDNSKLVALLAQKEDQLSKAQAQIDKLLSMLELTIK